MSTKKKAPKYYTSEPIRKLNANVNVVFGLRSYGKTYDMLYHIIEEFWQAKKQKKIRQAVYFRRRKESMKPNILGTVCKCLVCNGEGKNVIPELTDGQFDDVIYFRGTWTLCKQDPDTMVITKDTMPFMLAMDLSTWYNSKGGSFPFVNTIWFEEFMATQQESYLPAELTGFQQLLSTIARRRTDVTLWLTGNSVDLECPYFKFFGITDIETMECGTIRKYKYGKNYDKLIAVEYTNNAPQYMESSEQEDYAFAFDTEDTKLITEGSWQLGQYPLMDYKTIDRKDICGRFFILFDNKQIQCDIVCTNESAFIYMHRDEDLCNPIDKQTDLIYTTEYNTRQNYRRDITSSYSEAENIICTLLNQEKVWFDENLTGYYYKAFIKKIKGDL